MAVPLFETASRQDSAVSKQRMVSVRTGALVAAGVMLLHLAITFGLQNNESLRGLLSDLLFPIVAALAAGSLLYAARRMEERRARLAWGLFAAACLSITLFHLSWVIIEIWFSQVPFLTVADAFYFFYYPLFAAGLWFLPVMGATRGDRYKLLSDLGIVTTTSALVFWIFLIEPAWTAHGETDFFGAALLTINVTLDLILLVALFGLLFRQIHLPGRKVWLLLVVGNAAKVLADSFFSLQSLAGTYVSGGWMDLILLLGTVLIGLAGIVQVANPRSER